MSALNAFKEISARPRIRAPTTPTKPRSPKRIFSTSSSRLLQALDSADLDAPVLPTDSVRSTESKHGEATAPATTSKSAVDDPFLSVLSLKRRNRLVKLNLDKGIVSSPNFTPALTHDSPIDVEVPIADMMREFFLLGRLLEQETSEDSQSQSPAKPVSKGTKENVPANRSSVRAVLSSPPKRFPKYSYKNYKSPPVRLYIQDAEEADSLVPSLVGPLGFDLEWRVILRRGSPERPVATVQICDRSMILIIQISSMKSFPEKLKEILEDTNIPKIGVNILNDGYKLARDYGVRPQNLVELGGLARQADANYVDRYFKYAYALSKSPQPATPSTSASKSKDSTNPTSETTAPLPKMREPGYMIGLATITAMYTNRYLAKGPIQRSNWEAEPLSEAQLEYAANDAHCALVVYDTLMDMARKAGVKLDRSRFTQNVKIFCGRKPNLDDNNSEPAPTGSSGSSSGRSTTLSNPAVAIKKKIGNTEQATDNEQVQTEATSASVRKLWIAALNPSGVVRQRPQHIRAYNLWQHKGLSIPEMCATLRSADNPLKVGTVISYVVGALQADPSLHFSYDRLTKLLRTEGASWIRHKNWYNKLNKNVYINMTKC